MAKTTKTVRRSKLNKPVPAWSILAKQTNPTSSLQTHANLQTAPKSTNELEQRYHLAYQSYLVNDLNHTLTTLNALLSDYPDYARGYDFRGIIYARLGNVEQGIADFRQAIKLDAKLSSAYSNLANALMSQSNYVEALAAVQKAINLAPKHYDARNNLAIIQSKLLQTQEAIATFEQLAKDFPVQFAQHDPTPLIDIKKQICDWRYIKNYEQQAKQLIDQGKSQVKWALVHVNNHALDGIGQLKAMQLYTAQNFSYIKQLPCTKTPIVDRKIRVGYVSADFCDHATTRLMAEVFELQNHQAFDYYAISHSPNDGSPMRKRVLQAFDHVIEIGEWSDEKAVDYLRELKLDIVVDLKGYTGGSRLGIFARRMAPIQISYLGFPATTGSDFLDYIIGDQWVTPLGSQSEFSEKILQLPHCYQPNDSKRYLPSQACMHVNDPAYQAWRKAQRAQEGIAEDAIVLCCFNNTYKLHPDVFDVWLNVLKKIDKAIIWLLSDKPHTEQNLKNYAKQHGVDANRIRFAPRSQFETYLTRYLLADVFVDTLAYNAHTTGSDALWMGLPLITCRGNAFASRVGESLLNNVNLPQLVTNNLAEYDSKIVELCMDDEQLKTYSQYLRDNRLNFPLFDAKQLTHHLETLYKQLVSSAPSDLKA